MKHAKASAPTSDKADRSERLLEAAVEILRAAPGHRLNVTVLNKALFYLDLCALRDTGESVTRAPFIALDQGPVVAKYKERLLAPLADRGLAVQEDDEGAPEKPVVLRGTPPKPRRLDEYALAKAAEIAQFFSKQSSRAASERSHRNPGWLAAYKAGRGAKKPARAIDMRIAMQDVLGPDEWLDAHNDPEFDEAAREAEAGPNLPW